jgi:hypothetical protein
VRIGVAHHLGWAVVVTATDDHDVVDRRRIELIDAGVPAVPFEHDTKGLTDADAARVFEEVRSSALRATGAALDALAADLAKPIVSLSVRAWPPDFPEDLSVLRRPPYDARADSVLYCQVLAECADERGWEVHAIDAKDVEAQAARLLGGRADAVLHGPRAALGPPWAKDHRMALAATVLAAGG